MLLQKSRLVVFAGLFKFADGSRKQGVVLFQLRKYLVALSCRFYYGRCELVLLWVLSGEMLHLRKCNRL